MLINRVHSFFGISNILIGSKENELVCHDAGKENILFILKSRRNIAGKELQKLIAKGIAVFLIDEIKAFKICINNSMIFGLTAQDELFHSFAKLGEGDGPVRLSILLSAKRLRWGALRTLFC